MKATVSISQGMDEASANRKGMSVPVTTYFLIAQMAGAGFLALPKAMANTGWIGALLLFVFATSVGVSGIKLGKCWIILEERWPEYRNHVRQPYMEIAYRSFGEIGRKIIYSAVLINNFGATIVLMLLIAQFLHSLFETVSTCYFIVIVAVAITPLSWLGTPKDFWQASILATVSIVVTCIAIVSQLAVDHSNGGQYLPESPVYAAPTISSFSLGFASILFAFGGASVFPTIQNDMKDRSKFLLCVIITFTCLFILYFPVAVMGYAFLGEDVTSNILSYRGHDLSAFLKTAIVFEILNLIPSLLIIISPVFQTLEEAINIPHHFNIKRVLFRSGLIFIAMMIGLALPEFSYILNLIGGSTITLCSFIAPSLMFLRLIDDKSDKSWPEWSIPWWQRIYLYEIVGVGIIGGIASTVTSIIAIATADFGQSCFADFSNNAH